MTNEQKYLKRLEFDKVLQLINNYTVSQEAAELLLETVPASYLSDAVKQISMADSIMDILIRNNTISLISEDGISPVIRRSQKGSTLSMGELLRIKDVLRNSRLLKRWYSPTLEKAVYTDDLFMNLCEDSALENDIDRSIISENEMADEASSMLATIRKKITKQENTIRDRLDSMIHSPANAKYLQESIVTMRGGRFVVPVKIENKNAIPGLVHDVSSSGNTLFIEPTAVVEANNVIMQLKAEEQLEIDRILSAFSSRVSSISERLLRSHESFTLLDVLIAKAKYAIDTDSTIPELNSEGYIHLINARHPLIDKRTVVPINLELGLDYDALVITGPNTGGKTVTLKTVGILSAMVSSGIPVPVSQKSSLSVFKNILVDVGDEQSIEQSLSTFSSHIKNISQILESADMNSLVLLDELGSGTDPAEGAALAEAVLERLLDIGAKTIATSHYGEVKMFALETKRVENASCEFDIDSLSPTYRLIMGIPGQSNALLICQRLGLDQAIIESAKNKMDASNRRFEEVVARLESMNHELQKQKDELALLKNQAVAELEEAKLQSMKILEESKKENERVKMKSRQLSADVAAQASALIDELKKMDISDVESRKKNISRAKQILNHDSLDMVLPAQESERITADYLPVPDNVAKGDTVYVPSLSSNATVLSEPDEKQLVEIQSGAIRTKVALSDLRVPDHKEKNKKGRSVFNAPRSQSNDQKKTEIDVRGKTIDEAIPEIELLFDNARLTHIHFVSIIHGKGTGALRKGIQNWLRKVPYVKSYRLGAYGEGDAGVTVVELK